MCVQYIGRCSVHRRDIMSTSGDVQYIGGYHEYIGGYHDYIRGCSVHRGISCGEQSDKSLSIYIENPDVLMYHDIPHMYHDIPRCTEPPLMY